MLRSLTAHSTSAVEKDDLSPQLKHPRLNTYPVPETGTLPDCITHLVLYLSPSHTAAGYTLGLPRRLGRFHLDGFDPPLAVGQMPDTPCPLTINRSVASLTLSNGVLTTSRKLFELDVKDKDGLLGQRQQPDWVPLVTEQRLIRPT